MSSVLEVGQLWYNNLLKDVNAVLTHIEKSGLIWENGEVKLC